MTLGQMFVGGAPGGDGKPVRARNPHDFYATPAPATRALLGAERECLELHPVIWEPACGDGAIGWVLEDAGFMVVATDLRHTGYGVGGCDFMAERRRARAIITNPPFAFAADFIRHALSVLEVDYLALLLKATFWSADGRAQLWADHEPSREYQLTWRLDFVGLGNPVLDCCWFVWDRKAEPGCRKFLLRHPDKLTGVEAGRQMKLELETLNEVVA